MTRPRFHSIITRTIAGLGLFLGLAEMLGAAGTPAPPAASFVQDDARLFDAASVENMNRTLAGTERACGVSVYVVTSSYLDSVGSQNRGQQLVERWLNVKPGVILTHNRGDGQSGIVPSPELWRRHPADEIALILADAGGALTQPGASPERRIQDTVSLITERLQHLDASRHVPHGLLTSVERKLAISVAATIAVAGLAGWLGASVRRRKAAALGGPFYFPDATVNPRLGGQFGGGSIGESPARSPD